jgi:hypothetical protein
LDGPKLLTRFCLKCGEIKLPVKLFRKQQIVLCKHEGPTLPTKLLEAIRLSSAVDFATGKASIFN